MKIKLENYAGLALQGLLKKSPTTYKQFFGQQLIDSFMTDGDYIQTFNREQLDLRKKVIEELIYKDNYKIYIVTHKVGENEILKIRDPLKVIKLLDRVPVKRGMFVMNKEELFKYYFDGDDLYVIFIMMKQQIQVHYSAFHINLTTESIGGAQAPDLLWTLENFLRTLIYTFFSKNEFVFVNPGQKHGKTYNEKIWNESEFPITVVDSFWNKTIMRLEDFDVNGHFRLQACGQNWHDRELIWINPFKKHQYIRKAKHTQT